MKWCLRSQAKRRVPERKSLFNDRVDVTIVRSKILRSLTDGSIVFMDTILHIMRSPPGGILEQSNATNRLVRTKIKPVLDTRWYVD